MQLEQPVGQTIPTCRLISTRKGLLHKEWDKRTGRGGICLPQKPPSSPPHDSSCSGTVPELSSCSVAAPPRCHNLVFTSSGGEKFTWGVWVRQIASTACHLRSQNPTIDLASVCASSAILKNYTPKPNISCLRPFLEEKNNFLPIA